MDMFSTAEKSENDPVCKLDMGRKVRLCTQICAHFRYKCMDGVVVEEPCRQKSFSSANKSYTEWMLKCEMPPNTLPAFVFAREFFVARGYADTEAFIFRVSEAHQSLRLLLRLRRISFILDPMTRGEVKNTDTLIVNVS